MGLSEMTKNDLAAIEHMVKGCPDSICGKCGVRVDPYRCSMTTCTPVDKMYTCRICSDEQLEKQETMSYCPSCRRTSQRNTLCQDCENDRCPRHAKVTSPGIMNQEFGMWPTYKKEIPSCIDCAYWKERNPKDYAARIQGKYTDVRPQLLELRDKLRVYRNRYLYMEMVYDKPGVYVRYRGPIVDHKICHYCKEEDDSRHSPVFLIFRQGTRYQFCNNYRKDYKQCFEKWVKENDMRCKVEYNGVQCLLLKPHEGMSSKNRHEFRTEDESWIMTDLDMNVTYEWHKESGAE